MYRTSDREDGAFTTFLSVQDNVVPVSVDISRMLVGWELSGARVNVYRTSERDDGAFITTFTVPARMLGYAFALYPLSITTFVISRAEP